MESENGLDLLDQLVGEAVARIKADADATRKRKEAKAGGEPPAQPQALFTKPENWVRGHTVALIHEDTNTLLGNFTEYLHVSVAGARRLVRDESSGLTATVTESVSGSWWLAEERKPEPAQEWHTKRPAIIHAKLPNLGLHSPACEFTVHCSFEGITRAELTSETLFSALDGSEVLVTFPAGTNLLPELSLDCKVALKKELAL